MHRDVSADIQAATATGATRPRRPATKRPRRSPSVATDLAAVPDIDPPTSTTAACCARRRHRRPRRATRRGRLELADAIEATEDELERIGATPELPSLGAVEQAVDRLAAAERPRRGPGPRRPASGAARRTGGSELDALHTAVVDAESEAPGARRSTAARYETALAAEHEMLDELGFDSYVDALLSGGRLPTSQRHGHGHRRRRGSRGRRPAPTSRRHGTRAPLRPAPAICSTSENSSPATQPPCSASTLVRSRRPLRAAPGAVPETTSARSPRRSSASASRPEAGRRSKSQSASWRATTRPSTPDLAAALQKSRRELEADAGPAGRPSPWRPPGDRAAHGRRARRPPSRDPAGSRAPVARRTATTDPAHRAASAAALRDRILTLEAQLPRRGSDAEAGVAETAVEVEAATEHRDRARQRLLTLARHAARLAEDIVPERRPAFDAVTNVGALGGALRAEAEILADQIATA